MEALPADSHVVIRLQDAGERMLENVDVFLSNPSRDVTLRLELHDELDGSWGVPAPKGKVLAAVVLRILQGEPSNSSGADFTTLEFRLGQAALQVASTSPGEIRVARWTGTGWLELLTNPLGEVAGDHRFSAAGPGDGVFAILSPERGTPPRAEETRLAWMAFGVMALNGVIGAVLYYFRDSSVPELRKEYARRKRPWG